MKQSSLVQRVALVGGGLAAVAGAALLLGSPAIRHALLKALGLASDGANGDRPAPRMFMHSGSTVMHPSPLPGAGSTLIAGQRAADLIWSKPGTAHPEETAVNGVLTISRSELMELLKSAFPLHVAISADGEAWIEINELAGIKYEPGLGVVLRCSARVNYPLPVLPDSFTLTEVAVTILPLIIEREGRTYMQFKVDVSDIDLKFLPGFVDDVVSDKINSAIKDRADKIAWNASKTLNRHVRFPKRLSLLRGLDLGPVRATLEVANEGLIVRCVLPLTLTHETESVALPPDLPEGTPA